MHLRSGQGADLVMVEVSLDIGSLCASLVSERIAVPVVACGIGPEPSAAADAIRAGAQEYIPLPPDAELIAAVLSAVAEETSTLVFRDPATSGVLRLAEQVAPSDASVLITGESGTGKEVMARYLHSKSKRSAQSFISVNCAAIPENLLESELFGHEKGAFTGAVTRRVGKFEEANGGTLLLDEISEMHPRLQAKLLRAIQEREIDRVGGGQPIKVDIRLLATSNRNLEEEVGQGRLPRGSLLSLERRQYCPAAPARPPSGHSDPDPALCRQVFRGQRPAATRRDRCRAGGSLRTSLARQRAGAGKHHASRGSLGPRRPSSTPMPSS